MSSLNGINVLKLLRITETVAARESLKDVISVTLRGPSHWACSCVKYS